MLACEISVPRTGIEPCIGSEQFNPLDCQESPVYCPFEEDHVTLEAEGGIRQVSGPAGAPTSWLLRFESPGFGWGATVSAGGDMGIRAAVGKVCALATQSCPALCNPMDCSPPGSCVHGILQARIVKWVAISFFRGSS